MAIAILAILANPPLGLSLSHDIIVQGHRGELRVDSKSGEHTEFRIVLPKAADGRGQSARTPVSGR